MWKHVNKATGKEFLKHVVPALLKPARTLWNEVIGFVFLCFAVIFGFKTARTYLDLDLSPPEETTANVVRLCVTGFFTVLMLYFGVTNFMRARKISRS